MTTDSELIALAVNLTKPQQHSILILSDNWCSRQRPERMVWLPPDILETAAPLRTGHERVRLTPLGLRLRDHLRATMGESA